MKMFYSDNPAMDFTRFDAEQERKRERHCRGVCAHCGEYVYDYDDHYDMDGELVHSECFTDWSEQFRRGA